MTAAELIYLLCAATSLMAAALLFRHHRTRRTPLLFWTAISFFGLATNNVLLYIDLAVLTDVNLTLARTLAGAVAMVVLLFGLIRGTRA
jgi:predicted membrane-bound mannosyltransferase